VTRARAGTKGVPREEREGQILDIAAEEFGRRGYAHASIADIAQRAGISKPLVYGYFDSKEGLFQACLTRAGESLVEAVAAAQTGVAITRAIGTLAAIFETIEPSPYGWSILFDATLPRGSEIYDSAARYRRALIDLGSTGAREVLQAAGNTDRLDASLLTDIWLSTVTTVVQWWLEHPGQDAAATTQRCVRLLRTLAGAAGRTQRPRT
jgi:AcrR family transcriptional regulator